MSFGSGDAVAPTARTTVRRGADRAVYDRQAIYGILDEALICQVGFVDAGQPYVLPMNHVRIGDRLFVHGSAASRKLRYICAGNPVCITVTLLDGLVLARSAVHHTVNYRSVVILATGEAVQGRDEKREALRTLLEHVIPGRWDEVREPSHQEIDATMVVSFPLDEISAKVRTGPPQDREEDRDRPVWAGVLPLAVRPGPPVSDPQPDAELPVPTYVRGYRRP